MVDTLLERDPSKYDGAPQVDRVVSVPVFAPDGSLINEPGYHRTARVYYRPVSGLEELPPVTGDMIDRYEAVDWIRNELFAEFPFVEPADFANAVALFLLPFARDLIEGLTPMHAALAPSPGSGKDALVDTALRPSCGTVPKTAEIKSDDEMRKQITAHLLAGSSALVFDNIKTGLDSGALAAALTADVWRDRVLQHSKSVLLPIRNVWALTANNLRTTSEQARRMVPIFLDAQMERPDKRQFSRDLDTWIPRNRAMAVWSALTVIESWRTAERPEFFDSYTAEFRRPAGTRILNSYSSWSRVMGGDPAQCRDHGLSRESRQDVHLRRRRGRRSGGVPGGMACRRARAAVGAGARDPALESHQRSRSAAEQQRALVEPAAEASRRARQRALGRARLAASVQPGSRLRQSQGRQARRAPEPLAGGQACLVAESSEPALSTMRVQAEVARLKPWRRLARPTFLHPCSLSRA
jgi:hypothetical protein